MKYSNDDEKYKAGKKRIKSNLFLFTPDGNKAVLEYMRNLTPQVLFGGVWILFVVRSNTLNNYIQRAIDWSRKKNAKTILHVIRPWIRYLHRAFIFFLFTFR